MCGMVGFVGRERGRAGHFRRRPAYDRYDCAPWGCRTRTSIRAVEGDERTEEVARMLSGAKLTDTSRKHAEQMIKANG
jgi:hypothetical protein